MRCPVVGEFDSWQNRRVSTLALSSASSAYLCPLGGEGVFSNAVFHPMTQTPAYASGTPTAAPRTASLVLGPDWDPDGEWRSPIDPAPRRCPFLWQQAVINRRPEKADARR